jgi:hypothetical protein
VIPCSNSTSASAVAGVLGIAALLNSGGAGVAVEVTATEVQRFSVYHSPQTPGYTCWAGVLLLPDGALMVAFHQATGPFSGRPGAPPEILRTLSWPPAEKPAYDMTGTIQEIIRLKSTDGGETWEPFHAEPWHSPMNGGVGCSMEAVLPDGTIVRSVWGQYLPFYDVPHTGYLQRSSDGGRTWGPPQVFMDPDRFLTFPRRLRLLRDGRMALIGALVERQPGIETRADWSRNMKPSLWLSADEGRTWSASGGPAAVRPPRRSATLALAEPRGTGWGGLSPGPVRPGSLPAQRLSGNAERRRGGGSAPGDDRNLLDGRRRGELARSGHRGHRLLPPERATVRWSSLLRIPSGW